MAFQPDTRRHRVKRTAKPRRWRNALIGLAALGGLGGLTALLLALPASADPGTARQDLALAAAQFQRGNVTAARDFARAAAKADPSWGAAHVTLARYLLELGDGAGAEAELDRAKDAGFDPKRESHLFAHAQLLQGDPGRAIATAKQAAAPDRAYAVRIAARALAVQGDTIGAWKQLSALAAQYPRDSRIWSDLGRLHQRSGDLAAATEAASRAVALDPANGDALVLRGELIRTQYGLVGALPWFEQALKRDPADHQALIEYAATLGEAGRYRDMLAATRRAITAQPGDPVAYYLQAVLAARAGQDDLARAMLDKTGGQLAGMPGALLLGGSLDYAAGAWQQAITQWGALVAQQPRNITARRLLAAALLRTGDSKSALDVLRPVAVRGDADSYTLSLVGRAFELGGQRDWAGRFLDRAAAAARADATPFASGESLVSLGRARENGAPAKAVEFVRALLTAGDTDAALAQAQTLAARNPGVAAAQLLIGDIQAARKQWPAAVAAYRAAADRSFDEPTALRLVQAQDLSGDRAGASNTLALFLSQNPQNTAAQRLTAHWQIAAGQWDDAIDTLEDLRQRVGNRDAALLAELGYAFVGKGDAAGGEAYAAAAYRLAPTNPAAADSWGWALYALGDYDRAGQLLEKAASLSPRNADVRQHLAETYRALGKQDLAAQQAKAAAALS